MSARTRSYTGRGGVPEPTGTGVKTDLASGAGRSPPPTGGSGGACGGVWSPRPTGATLVVPSSGPMWASAPTGGRRGFSNHPGQRRTAERLRQRSRGNGWKSRQRSSPKCPATSDNPSVTAAPCQFPLHKGALGDGGCGLPRRPCGPPRNDNGFLSFRGAERRGNPSFLRWTGVRAAEVVGPYGRSAEVSATGRCGHRPLRVVAESCRECQGSALSAEKGAGQIRSLPDTLRVQHGVLCPEVSARPRPCSRRSCVN